MLTAGFSLPGFDGAAARVPNLRAGRRLDEADRVEVRQRRHAPVARSRRPAVARGHGADRSDPEHAEHLHLSSQRQRRRIGGGVHARRTPRRWPRISGSPTRRRLITTRPRAAAGRGHRIDARAHGRAVARSAAGRRLRFPGLDRDVCRRPQGSPQHDLRRRQRRHDPRDRRADRLRGVGVHPLQPAAEAADAARRPAGRTVRLLRRQLAEDRRSQDERRLAMRC